MPGCQACQAEEQVQRHVQRAPAPTPVAATPVPPAQMLAVLGHPHLGGRGNGPVHAAAVQQMQQTYGNRAVQRFLARQAGALPLQRCGATPCNCSSEEKARHTAEETS